jgi:UDPglucose--hexose-1-phosphate uridylyltransferase
VTTARLDPLTGRWVVLAPGRARRPDTVEPAPASAQPDGGPARVAGCPFCPGNEHLTPPEVARTGPGAAGAPGWHTRVFPNRYPIVDASVDGPHEGPPDRADPLRAQRPAGGAHEVVVLSPDHRRSLGRLGHAQVTEVLTALRDRARTHAAAGRRYTQVLVNHGAAGGASLVHPHAQVVAVDLEPPEVCAELTRLTTPSGCVVCLELARHAAEPALVVATAPGAELWCPWASRSAYEMLLAPRRHRPRFEDASDELPDVAALLQDGLARLDRVAPGAAYNLAVHTRPAGATDDYHWHAHVWPRLQREGGFELGSGLPVDIVDPARAAADLASADG